MLGPDWRSIRCLTSSSFKKVEDFVAASVVAYPPLTLFLVGFVSWGLFLFNIDGIYWDDWVLVTQPPKQVGELMLSLGGPLTALMHIAFLTLGNSVTAYRVFSFLATFFVGYATYKILLRTFLFNRFDALTISSLAIAFPVFQSRVALINVPTQMYLALFMGAWLLALANENRASVFKRSASILLFFFAVQYQSLLLFFVVPLTHLFWLACRGRVESSKELFVGGLLWSRRHLDFLLVPFAAVIFQKLIASPPALYAGYNSITIKGLVRGVWLSAQAFETSFVRPIVSSSPPPLIIFFIILFATALPFIMRARDRSDRYILPPEGVILLGSVLFVVAVYPYAAVGKLASAEDWASRLQILVPAGAALIIFGTIKLLSRGSRLFVAIVAIYFIISFAILDMRYVYAYHVDWLKQAAIIAKVRELSIVREGRGRAFVFIDKAPNFNAQGRTYRFYELSGFLREAFSDQSRLATLPAECSVRESYSRFTGMMYNIDGYRGDSVAGVIVIEPSHPPESFSHYISSIFKSALSFDVPHSSSGLAIVNVRFEGVDKILLPADCK